MKRIKYLKLRKSFTGFTLIELLVVIGILAIMAAALIATLDPFEQIKKGQDATVKNLASEFQSAVVRYYGTHNALPWDTIANGGGGCNAGAKPTAPGSTLTTLMTCITALVTDGELKASFPNTSATQLSQVMITNGAGGVDTIACFKPTSKSQLKDPNTKYSNVGVVTAGCPGGANCYWCIQ